MILRRVAGLQKGMVVGPLSLVLTPGWLQKIEMFKVQFAYGQREILTDYMGLDRSTLLLGILQHGFSHRDDPADAITPRLGKFKRSPLWVYSKNRESALRHQGFNNVTAIGAPWLYLPPISATPNKPAKGDSFIVFPIHTSLSVNVSPSESDIRHKIKYWKSLAGENHLTICLYWSDYLEWSWRRIAEAEGVEVTVVGLGETTPIWSAHNTRVDFLVNLRTLFQQHSHAIFETFTSGMIYAISTGLTVGYFPQTQTDYESRLQDHIEGDQWMARHIPGTVGEFVGADALLDRNNKMLGLESFCTPEQLRELLVYETGIVPWYQNSNKE
jgi:hypothetical protein